MNRMRAVRARRMQQQKLSRVLMFIFLAILLVGLATQTGMVLKLSGQNRAVRSVEREIRNLSANVDNLNLSLNQFKSLERVAVQAGKLGMEQPSDSQIRVVSLPAALDNMTVQSAGNTGGGETRE